MASSVSSGSALDKDELPIEKDDTPVDSDKDSRSEESHTFVNGVIKIIEGTEGTQTRPEAEAVNVFRKETTSVIQNLHEDEGKMMEVTVEEEIARLKTIAKANALEYDDGSWIPATTCEVERFFLQCKLNHSDKRIAHK
jgi:hypothetical protein